MKVKSAKEISVIGGADGPTSVFIAGNNRKNIIQQLKKYVYRQKRKRIEKKIVACPHTMDEVLSYVKQRYNYIEVNKNSEEYQSEYCQMRVAFILQYAPKLLGEYCEAPTLKDYTEEALKEFQVQLEKRQKMAESISCAQFDIDFYMLKLKRYDFTSTLYFEKKFEYIGGSASGNKKAMKQFNKLFLDVYQYFGVDEIDIKNKTSRYKELVSILLK